MTKCFVENCKSSDRKHAAGVTFHKIPANRTKEWLKAIKRPQNTLINNQRLCSLHFCDDEFERIGVRKRVKPGVVPSKILPLESPLTSPFSVELPECEVNNGILTVEWVGTLKDDEMSTDDQVFLQPDCTELTFATTSSSNKEHLYQKLLTSEESLDFSPRSEFALATTRNYERKTVARRRVIVTESPEVQVNMKRNPSSSDASSPLASLKRHVALMHNYSLSPKHYEKQIKTVQQKVYYYREKLKTAIRTSQRRKRKIQHLRQVVKELRKKTFGVC
ncbi:hypothetical protein RI129_008763 [Pyrocoelia pectoralis]|uniref:THAP-type domain-containing protein n=1 Tax=Pyrocoelia pectoralis TaxID=417401 RepID=A0AAN7VBP6_9COLE